MSRYIDAEWLKAEFPHDEDWNYPVNTNSYVVRMIYDAPSIDLDDYVPKDFHDKTCEAMAKRHQEEIADILERADADRPQGWIPCSERLPRESGYYLCCNNGYLPYVGHFINGRWSDFDCTIVHADAWMPLPKPYGEREGE